MNVLEHCLPADHPVSRDVPTLIHDSAAWVKAEHYDNAKADRERLSRQLAGAVEALQRIRDHGQTHDEPCWALHQGL